MDDRPDRLAVSLQFIRKLIFYLCIGYPGVQAIVTHPLKVGRELMLQEFMHSHQRREVPVCLRRRLSGLLSAVVIVFDAHVLTVAVVMQSFVRDADAADLPAGRQV